MGIKDLVTSNEVTIKFYGIKDDKGALFYNAKGAQIELPMLNLSIDSFLLNPKAKYLICISDCNLQMSDLLVDFFPEDDVLSIDQQRELKFLVIG